MAEATSARRGSGDEGSRGDWSKGRERRESLTADYILSKPQATHDTKELEYLHVSKLACKMPTANAWNHMLSFLCFWSAEFGTLFFYSGDRNTFSSTTNELHCIYSRISGSGG